MTRLLALVGAAAPGVLLTVLLSYAAEASAHAGNSDPNAIHACKGGFGAVRIVGVTGSCTGSETAIHWNIQGPAGPPGGGSFLIGGGTGDTAAFSAFAVFIPMFDSRASTGINAFRGAAQRIPLGGTISNLSVVVDTFSTAPGAPTTNTFRIVTSAAPGDPPAESELTCTVTIVTGAATVCVDDTHSVVVAAGHFVALKVDPGLIFPESTVRWTAVFTPD